VFEYVSSLDVERALASELQRESAGSVRHGYVERGRVTAARRAAAAEGMFGLL